MPFLLPNQQRQSTEGKSAFNDEKIDTVNSLDIINSHEGIAKL